MLVGYARGGEENRRKGGTGKGGGGGEEGLRNKKGVFNKLLILYSTHIIPLNSKRPLGFSGCENIIKGKKKGKKII